MKDATSGPIRGVPLGPRRRAVALVWAGAVVILYLAVRELGLDLLP